MNERTKTGLQILEVAAVIGVLGNVLLREGPWSLNAFLFVSAFSAATIMLMIRRRPELVTTQTLALLGAMVFFSSMMVWRASIQLKMLDFVAIIAGMSVLILQSVKVNPKISGVFHYAAGFVWSSLNATLSGFVLLGSDIDYKLLPQSGWSKHLISVLRGVLIAIPMILVFGALFVAADAAYEGMVQRVLNIAPETVFTHILLTAVFAWLTAGYLRGLLVEKTIANAVAATVVGEAKSELSKIDQIRAEEVSNPNALPDNRGVVEHINQEESAEEKAKPDDTKKESRSWQEIGNTILPGSFTLGAIETGIILGLLDLLFLSFVIVQIPYLFGGMDLVQNTPDFKLAEYARRGFGELVAVAFLVLPVLLLSHWLLRKDNPLAEKIYRVFAGVQIVLLFVIMASASQRLMLLTGNLGYGLTTDRLYPMIFMVWLGIVFVWFALTVLRGARQYFAWGALWSAFFVLAGTHVLNPDEFVARHNIRLMQLGRDFDGPSNARLSDDAVPVLLEALPTMSMDDQCAVKSRLSDRLTHARTENDLRTWNWSRRAALNAMEARSDIVTLEGCPGIVPWAEDIHD
jgi:hypothetical protein